jgi:repressor LexA
MMSFPDLTDAQQRGLAFIQERLDLRGIAPTLREMCAHMGFKAIGSAQDLIAALRKKGFLETPDQQSARALVLTAKARAAQGDVTPTIDDGAWLIPCLGMVPAGNPLEAVESRIGTITVSPGLFATPRPRPELLFALRAKGLSMRDAGILDGDWLIVKSQQEARVGEIVVARLDDDATVKRLMKDPSRGYFLQPENIDFKPIFGDESPFQLVGRVVALQRLVL